VALSPNRAVKLACALRGLPESTWPHRELTQAQLAKALSSQGRVAAATWGSCESLTNPKTPSVARTNAYAPFFCTELSLKGEPRLTDIELDRFRELESKLMALPCPESREVRRGFSSTPDPSS
jgi:hypothetical protein